MFCVTLAQVVFANQTFYKKVKLFTESLQKHSINLVTGLEEAIQITKFRGHLLT